MFVKAACIRLLAIVPTQKRMIMRSTPFRTAFFALLLTCAAPSVLAAAPSAPLQLSQAELLKY